MDENIKYVAKIMQKIEIHNNNHKKNMRTAKLTIILGTNGTGKTTMLRHILESSPQRALVVTSHVEEWTDLPENNLAIPQDFLFHDRQRHIIRRGYTIERLKYFKQGILIFDDCKTFIGDKNAALEE